MLTDEDVLEIVRREPLLTLLATGPLDRAEIEERLGMSRSTSHRCTRALRDLDLAHVREDGKVALTPLGDLVAREAGAFRERVDALGAFAPFVQALAGVSPPFDVHAFAGAVVTHADAHDPFRPLDRFMRLMKETKSISGCDLVSLGPLYLPQIRNRIVDGLVAEDVTVPDVVRSSLAHHGAECYEACASGNLRVHLRHEMPFSLAIFDARVGVGVREPGTRRLRVFIDTDAPEAREWAEAVFAAYHAGTVRLPHFTEEGLREALRSM